MNNNRPAGKGKSGNSGGFNKENRGGGFKKDFKAGDNDGRKKRDFGNREGFSRDGSASGDRRKSGENKPFNRFEKDGQERPARKFDRKDKPAGEQRFSKDKDKFRDKPFNREDRGGRFDKKERGENFGDNKRKFGDKPFNREDRGGRFDKKEKGEGFRENKRTFGDKPFNREDRGGRFDKKERGEGFRENKRTFGDKPFNREDRGGRFDKKGREEGFEKDKFNGPKRESKFNKNEKDNKSKKFSERNVFHEEKPQKPVEDYEKNFITPKEFEKTVEDKPKFAGIRSKQEDTFDKAFPLGAKKVSGPFRKKAENADGKPAKPRKKDGEQQDEPKEMTLNKYISHSGTCSRREAAEMVKQGKVKVNGELALDPGYRVQPYDLVTIAGKKLTPQKNRVYILLNKPKGYITTTDDPEGRDTVMDLVEDATTERLYPVGRLDRNTTGLILLTNDGDLAQKLSHPSYETKKVYQVTLDKPLTKIDFEKILAGLTLEDGEVKVDALSYLDEKNELGIEIHSGRNRIVRRIFESLGYVVEKLDRVMYAGLTKKKLPRGEWRFLEDKEVILLKHFKS